MSSFLGIVKLINTALELVKAIWGRVIAVRRRRARTQVSNAHDDLRNAKTKDELIDSVDSINNITDSLK